MLFKKLKGGGVLGVAMTVTIFTAMTTLLQGQPVSTGTRYTPFACDRKAIRQTQTFSRDALLSWRSRWPDTATSPWAEAVALERTVRAEMLSCLAPYTVETTPMTQLAGLGAAYLTVEDTTQAAAAFARLLKLTANASIRDRIWYLSRVVSAYGETGYLPQAFAAAAKLDSLGPVAALQRLKTHNRLYDIVSMGRDSIPLMLAQVHASRAAIEELLREVPEGQKLAQQEARQQAREAWQDSWIHAMDVEARRADYIAFKRLNMEGRAELSRIFPEVFFQAIADDNAMVLGGPAPALWSDFIYIPGQPTASPTGTRPTRGKVSLFVSFPGTQFVNDDFKYYQMVDILRRKYSPDVLEITLVARASGRDMRRLTTEKDPAAESEKIRAFIQDYLMLQIPVAVRKTTYQTNPINGRQDPVGVDDLYRSTKIVLVDKNGIVRFMDATNFLRLDHMIQEYAR